MTENTNSPSPEYRPAPSSDGQRVDPLLIVGGIAAAAEVVQAGAAIYGAKQQHDAAQPIGKHQQSS